MTYFYWATGLFLAAAAAILASVYVDNRDSADDKK